MSHIFVLYICETFDARKLKPQVRAKSDLSRQNIIKLEMVYITQGMILTSPNTVKLEMIISKLIKINAEMILLSLKKSMQ